MKSEDATEQPGERREQISPPEQESDKSAVRSLKAFLDEFPITEPLLICDQIVSSINVFILVAMELINY